MKRRIIAVLAAGGARRHSSGQASRPPQPREPDGAAYVALGDSVASGNGHPPVRQGRRAAVPALEEVRIRCSWRRSSGSPSPRRRARRAHDCRRLGSCRQLSSRARSDPTTELVTLTVGVNDVRWGQNLRVRLGRSAHRVQRRTCASAGTSAVAALGLSRAVTGAASPQTDRRTDRRHPRGVRPTRRSS